MNHLKIEKQNLKHGLYEMEAAIERLREEIQRLTKERDALEKGNLTLYRQLYHADF